MAAPIMDYIQYINNLPICDATTREILNEYIEILKTVDKAYIMDIHGSRESEGDISSDDLIKKIPKAEAINIDEAEKLTKHKDSVILFMSPNDISKLENDLVDLLGEKE